MRKTNIKACQVIHNNSMLTKGVLSITYSPWTMAITSAHLSTIMSKIKLWIIRNKLSRTPFRIIQNQWKMGRIATVLMPTKWAWAITIMVPIWDKPLACFNPWIKWVFRWVMPKARTSHYSPKWIVRFRITMYQLTRGSIIMIISHKVNQTILWNRRITTSLHSLSQTNKRGSS